MQWTFSERKGEVLCTAGAGSLSDAVVDSLWKKLNELLPKQSKPWDHLRVELWDGGRILAFPSSSTARWRVDQVCCELTIEELAEAERERDGLSDDEAERKQKQAEAEVRGRLFEGARRVLGTSGVRMRVHSADSEHYEALDLTDV